MAVLRTAARAKLGLPWKRGQAGEGTRRFGSRLGGARQARRTLALVLLAVCAAASAAGGLWALVGLEDARRLIQHTEEVIGESDGLLAAKARTWSLCPPFLCRRRRSEFVTPSLLYI